MKNKPTKSVVAKIPFDIVYENDPTSTENGQRCFGYCDSETTSLVIDEELSDYRLQYYLAHEIAEQINDLHFMGLEHDKVGTLGKAFLEYIQDNPNVIKFLQEKFK